MSPRSNPDLFPETLIVTLVDGHPVTNSLLIADHFGKRHDNVLKAIKTLIQRTTDAGRLLNFEETSYPDVQGRPQPMYLLNRNTVQWSKTMACSNVLLG